MLFSGITGYILLALVGVGVLVAIAVAVGNAIKNGKNEDAEEDEFSALAEYSGVDGFVAPTADDKKVKEPETVEEIPAEEEPEIEEIAEEPESQTAEQTQPLTPPPETENTPAESETPAAEPAAPAPAVIDPKNLSEDDPIAADSVPLDQRQGDWSNYDGEYDDYYYDPIDACYYEGKPPVYVQKMYLPPAPDPIIKKIANPAAPDMTKPRAARKEVDARNKDIVSAIYGQYIIENEGDEYFFTLYSNKGETLFESFNYASEEFCKNAVKRFKKHVLAGAFSVEEKDGKFHFVLTRKINTYYGPDKATRVEAEKSIEDVKYYAVTDIIRNN